MRTRAALLTVLAGTALVAAPAGPAAAASCAQDSGVTVVVDFASLGDPSQQCAPGDPSSGIAALRAAGFAPTRAAQQPGYFVCRIDGKPVDDPCQRTSPADAYWSYWHAKPGGSWTYGTVGANDYDPAPGAVEGWAFGSGKPPSTPPPRAAPAAASPVQSPPRPSPAGRSAAPTSKPATRPAAARPTSPLPAVTAPSGPPSALPSSLPPSPSAQSVGSPRSRPVKPPASSATGPLVAAGLVAVLVAAAAGTAVRRRRAS